MADLSNVDLHSTHVPFDAMRGLLAIGILLSLQMIYLCKIKDPDSCLLSIPVFIPFLYLLLKTKAPSRNPAIRYKSQALENGSSPLASLDNFVLATFCKFFKNAENSQGKWGKILFARMVIWLGNIYIKGFSN